MRTFASVAGVDVGILYAIIENLVLKLASVSVGKVPCLGCGRSS